MVAFHLCAEISLVLRNGKWVTKNDADDDNIHDDVLTH